MKVLLLGSGGREHTLSWKMAQSPKLTQLFIAPGNPGTAKIGINLPFAADDFHAIKAAVLEHKIDMIVVGPEDPLVKGVRDFVEADAQIKAIPVIGPDAQGAALEGSKDFSKAFMEKYKIPTAKYKSFQKENIQEGFAFLESLSAPYVLKADGLAAGKGVLILEDLTQAKEGLQEMLDGKFGEASSKVVIEEYLHGIEVSMFVLTDGYSYKLLPEAKDYKRIGVNDTGLNTGGMGSVSPVPFVDDVFVQKVKDRIIEPTLKGLQNEGILYKGFIFIGLMNCKGEPEVIEYNVRMGDPETESVMLRLDADLLDLFEGVAQGNLKARSFGVLPHAAASVVAVSGGYPESFTKGYTINGLENANNSPQDGIIFHAGTAQNNGNIVNAGGRVLVASSIADNLENALQKSYANLALIHFEDMYYRSDIGQDILRWK